MIESAEEFVRLRTSPEPADYRRAAAESAPFEVWEAIVADRPDMRFWVAQNKTVPLSILRCLRQGAIEIGSRRRHPIWAPGRR